MGRLDSMLLWGNSLSDYQQMFALTADDLKKNILNFGAGLASFNAEMHALGHNVVSCDSVYDLSLDELRKSFEKEFQQMIDSVKTHQQCFVWDQIKTPEALEQARRQTTGLFLDDYTQGKQQGRYKVCHYPDLDQFVDQKFSLALASHAVFITNSDKPAEYLVEMLLSLSKIAHEVRVFPLLDAEAKISPLVGPVLLGLQQQGLGTEVREVDYQFQRGGNAMLRLWTDACDV